MIRLGIKHLARRRDACLTKKSPHQNSVSIHQERNNPKSARRKLPLGNATAVRAICLSLVVPLVNAK